MTTPVEKRNASKFCEFHGEVGKGNKKGGNLGKGQAAGNTYGATMAEGSQTKDYPNFLSRVSNLFPPLGEEDGTEGPMIIEAEMGGHFVHRMYVDGGSSSKILYEHCFNRFRSEVKNHMVLATTPLVGFSGEIIWPLGKISLLVKIGDEEHSTSAWMNFMIVRSPSPYNIIIGRPGSSRIIPLECTMVSGPGVPQLVINQVTKEKKLVSNSPRISETNYSNRLYFDRRRVEGAMRPTKAKPRYIRLEASGYNWSSTSHSIAQSKYS
ncbi:hypothetical protein Tco_0562410 [Tanacetum coccineum]